MFRIRINIFYTSPDPDQQKIRIESGTMKKTPKTVSTRTTKKMFESYRYLALSKLPYLFWVRFLQNLIKEHHLVPISLLKKNNIRAKKIKHSSNICIIFVCTLGENGQIGIRVFKVRIRNTALKTGNIENRYLPRTACMGPPYSQGGTGKKGLLQPATCFVTISVPDPVGSASFLPDPHLRTGLDPHHAIMLSMPQCQKMLLKKQRKM